MRCPESYEDKLARIVGDNYQMLHDYLGYPEVQQSILDELMAADEAAGKLALAGVSQLPVPTLPDIMSVKLPETVAAINA